MFEGELKVNGDVIPLNDQMRETLFKTCAGFTRSLRGVKDPIVSIELVLEEK